MKLFALSDLHVGHRVNRDALETLGHHPEDWLILAGDIGETVEHLRVALDVATARFDRVIWVPGNHELWSMPRAEHEGRGEAKYNALVDACRAVGVITPEDPYPMFPTRTGSCAIVPMFLLYDYTFRPPEVPHERALQWAMESGVVCTDEALLFPDPYPSREAWCAARCESTQRRLDAIPQDVPTILVNHFPLRRDLAQLPLVPRFSIWCGTTRTEDWHLRYRARAVVSGHLHIRSTRYRDGIRFEEVSLGYPRQWDAGRGMDAYLRQIDVDAERR